MHSVLFVTIYALSTGGNSLTVSQSTPNNVVRHFRRRCAHRHDDDVARPRSYHLGRSVRLAQCLIVYDCSSPSRFQCCWSLLSAGPARATLPTFPTQTRATREPYPALLFESVLTTLSALATLTIVRALFRCKVALQLTAKNSFEGRDNHRHPSYWRCPEPQLPKRQHMVSAHVWDRLHGS